MVEPRMMLRNLPSGITWNGWGSNLQAVGHDSAVLSELCWSVSESEWHRRLQSSGHS